MPPSRRPRLASRPSSSAGAADRSRRGWLPARRERQPSKRPWRASSSSDGGDEDGTPLTDEILVGIFAGLPEITDLVRCAATCSRWCRLVSSEAAFICRTTPRPWPGRFVRRLALGFFHQGAAELRFAPTASAARLVGLLRTPSLKALVERPENGLFHCPRLVASRNGLIVTDLRRGIRDRTIKLCVCNPMTGEVNILPPLSGEDGIKRYACTVLTADDHDQTSESDPPPAASYRVILFYNTCRSNAASRSYSSEEGVWSPEAIRSERFGKKQMGMGVTRTAVVVEGGKAVCWFAKNAVLALSLNTLHAQVLSRTFVDGNTILGVSPEKILCTVEMIFRDRPRCVALRVSMLNRSIYQRQEEDEVEFIHLEQHLPADVTKLQLRWFCEKSGVVLFTAGYSDGRSEVYALSLDKQEVHKIASHDAGGGGGDPWENLHGYEMDRAAYLATFGVGNDHTRG